MSDREHLLNEVVWLCLMIFLVCYFLPKLLNVVYAWIVCIFWLKLSSWIGRRFHPAEAVDFFGVSVGSAQEVFQGLEKASNITRFN